MDGIGFRLFGNLAIAPAMICCEATLGGLSSARRGALGTTRRWGGLVYLVTYLKTSVLFDRLVEDAPFHYTSPNAPEVRDVVGTAILSIQLPNLG